MRGNIFLAPRLRRRRRRRRARRAHRPVGRADRRERPAHGRRGALAWGRPLAVAAVALLARRLATMSRVPARVFDAAGDPARVLDAHRAAARPRRQRRLEPLPLRRRFLRRCCWPSNCARRSPCSRWRWPRWRRPPGSRCSPTSGTCGPARRYLRAQAPPARARPGALELARPSVPPGYVAKHFPGTPFMTLGADAYFAAAKAYGTPAYSPDRARPAPESARRRRRRRARARIARRRAAPGARHRADREPPEVDAVSGGTPARAGCVRRPGNGALDGGARPSRPAGCCSRRWAGPPKSSVRRFATGFPREPLTTPHGSGDAADRPRPRPAALARPAGTQGERLKHAARVAPRSRRRGLPARRPDGAGLLLRRLLRRAAADRRDRRLGARARARRDRAARRSRASRAGRLAVAGLALLAAWSAVSIAWAPLRGPGGRERPAARALPRRAARRRRRAARARGRCARVEPALAAARRSSSATGSPAGCCRADRARPLAQRRRPARAADHLLERRGRAGRDRARAVRAPGRRPHPRARAAMRRPRRRASRSAPASTCPTRAARSPPRCSGCVAAGRRGARRAPSCGRPALALGAARRRRARLAPRSPASRRWRARSRPHPRRRDRARASSSCSPPRRRCWRSPRARADDAPLPWSRRRARPPPRRSRSPPSSIGLVVGGLGERPTPGRARGRRQRRAGSRPSAPTATSTGASALDAFARPPADGPRRRRLPRRSG